MTAKMEDGTIPDATALARVWQGQVVCVCLRCPDGKVNPLSVEFQPDPYLLIPEELYHAGQHEVSAFDCD